MDGATASAHQNGGNDMGRLSGKRAIVTGAGSGIGRASALLFAAEGAAVLAVDKVMEAASETARMAGTTGGQVLPAAADAATESEVAAFVARAVSALGGLDIVYANAGISGGVVPLLDQSVESWTEMLRVNLIGPFLAIKHAAPVMIRQQTGGSIICTASLAGLRGGGSTASYAASKAGVISLVQNASHNLMGTNIRVNAICPGLIETGMTRTLFERARERGTERRIGHLNPAQRAGQPEEIAAMALFLAGEDASYVNGQAIPVDGGHGSSLPFHRWRP
jgi:NAD(P)-dependent dehydrogenase (short-subunit alcohol dehydrogenase family)